MRRLLFGRGLPKHWPLILPIAIGSGLLVQAAIIAAPTISFAMHAVRTEGLFIGAVTGPRGDHGGGFYHPMFRYPANDGSIRTFTAQNGSTSHPYRDGEKATVLYDPQHPENARLSSFSELWLSPLAIGLPGLLLAAFGTLLLGAARRRDAETGR